MMKIALVVAGLAIGCESSKPPPRPPPGEGIELIDAGSLPHRELRYRLAKGTSTWMELAMDLDLALGPRGGPMPTLVMRIEIRADDTLPDGSAKVRTRIHSVAARDRPNSAVSADIVQAQSAALAGLEISATLSPRGTLSDSKVATTGKELPPALTGQVNQLSQSLEQVAMALPEAPVGVGARWRTRKSVEQNGVKMQTVTTLEVVAIDGDRVTFTSASEVTGADQQVVVEGTPVSISKVGGSGRNTGVIDLARMVVTGELGAEFHFDMKSRDQVAGMSMRLATRLRPLPSSEVMDAAPAPATQGAQSAP